MTLPSLSAHARLLSGAAVVSALLAAPAVAQDVPLVYAAEGAAIGLSVLGTHQSGIYEESAAEIVTYDAASKRGFVINAAAGAVDVMDLSDPTQPVVINTITLTEVGAGVNSISIKNGVVAMAVQNNTVTDNGFVVLADIDGAILATVEVGALPDALTFSPDGNWVLVVNEGEPREDFGIDPEGSISVIDISGGAATVTQANVRTADFRAYNGQEDALREAGVRIFGPGASAAQDFEPEWVEVSSDSTTAYASLQENNAIAVIDIASATITDVLPLGFKDWSENGAWSGAGLDTSRKGEVNIRHWPVFGILLPDTIRVFEVAGETYILTANEGDARAYDEDGWWLEEFAIEDLQLDATAFPNAAELQEDTAIGKLLVTSTLGVANECNPSLSTAEVQALGYAEIGEYVAAECVYDALYTFGGRSASIFKVGEGALELVWDSGSDFEEITLAANPDYFNADHAHRETQLKRRSVNKGPEPEGAAIGEIDGRLYGFIGFERVGGVMVYDITEPANATFVTYINNRDFSLAHSEEGGTTTDLGAEGLYFIPAADSPDAQGRPVLMVGNEVSGTTTLFAIDRLAP
ncbi:choice-of-anchor I family protein [Ketogulonicigenium vulgare]|uniref:Alkaline phosphatase family protein n=1 Tax=Ketogulonicigenium vulgare (strain WSH-001) TaxID=759362 RepID=F9Y4Y7_KETVW|nr:choice-of-anchor I family protein [Ketogulonicigenium vulgare]ADO43598.1 alkaline phosphatase [Ketogulonicigenium vulgare Y25]AEM41871.1 Alkaline phosphatase family protein [Ketogulonicigenium vulgare WSH-001]ALJ81979.1 alkaline phosphatase [Ketogulonicigenium vulgare]ANW34617.1 alkaline phosphatase [Ketogulonicigenium vulgare]AOZ55632.1 alkaline phosphatase [Ketogulonicigenium vulgare]